MFAFKIFALVSLALVASASDVDEFDDIVACFKKALTNGADDFDIPDASSSLALSESFTWSGDILGTHYGINMSAMTLYNTTDWIFNATQLSLDSDADAVFKFNFTWPSLSLGGSFEAVQKLIIETKESGTFSVGLTSSIVEGTMNVTKPTNTTNATIDDVSISWNVGAIVLNIDGLIVGTEAMERAIETLLQSAFNNNLFGKFIGKIVKTNLQLLWLDTGALWKLVDWCDSN